jgi:hypothetical protein
MFKRKVRSFSVTVLIGIRFGGYGTGTSTQHLGSEILVYCLVITVVIWIRTWRTCCRGRRRRARSRPWTTRLWHSSWACDRTRSPAAASVTPRSHQASQTKPNFLVQCSLPRSGFSTPHCHWKGLRKDFRNIKGF